MARSPGRVRPLHLAPHRRPRKNHFLGHALARERLREKAEGATAESKRYKTAFRNQLNLAILHNALFRVPAIGRNGWRIRKRLQEFIYRARGRKNERLEILGRGENKIGYLEQSERLIHQRALRNVPYADAVEKYGYPTDLVVKNRTLSLRPGRKREPTTWLMEVEPGGLGHLSDKIDVLHRALARRFRPSADAPQTRNIRHQLPEEASRLAIVFYTGSHPTLNDATQFLQDYQREHNITNLPAHFKKRGKKIYTEQYQPRVLAGHDQPKILEQQLNEVLNNEEHRRSILASQYPVYWLVPVGDALLRIDLKKAVRMHRHRPNDIMHRPLYVPTPRRKKSGINLHQNIKLPSLDALRRFGAAKYVATLRPAIIN